MRKFVSFAAVMALTAILQQNAFASLIRCEGLFGFETVMGETAADAPWGPPSRLISREGESKGLIGVAQAFEALFPEIDAQLWKDAVKGRGRLEIWGNSINFDELVKGVIVDPLLLDVILQKLDLPARQGRVVHAGAEQLYGYLFSTLQTQFGYKRARWVQPEIARGFGLPARTLGPAPRGNTLLANLTYFLGRFAFRGEQELLTALESGKGTVAAALRKFDFEKVPITRVEEKVELERGRTVTLRTDLVPFQKLTGPNVAILIYSIHDSAVGRSQLLSAFPVGEGMVYHLTGAGSLAARQGEVAELVPRYNAAVAGFESPRPGVRRILAR